MPDEKTKRRTVPAPPPGVAPEGTNMTVIDELLSPPPPTPLPGPVPTPAPKASTVIGKRGTITQVIE